MLTGELSVDLKLLKEVGVYLCGTGRCLICVAHLDIFVVDIYYYIYVCVVDRLVKYM